MSAIIQVTYGDSISHHIGTASDVARRSGPEAMRQMCAANSSSLGAPDRAGALANQRLSSLGRQLRCRCHSLGWL